MFENAELGRTLSKNEFDRELPKLGTRIQILKTLCAQLERAL